MLECSIVSPRRTTLNLFAGALGSCVVLLVFFGALVMMHGIASAATDPTAPVLHDPVTDPLGAWSDLELASKTSWPLAAFAGLTLLTKVLAYFSPKLVSVPIVGTLATFLAGARNAAIVAGIGTIALALYNVLGAGGTWTAAIIAGGLALAGILHPTAPAQVPA